MSPAKAEPERTQLRAIAVAKRFIDVLLVESGMQDFLHRERIEQHLENLARLAEGN
jgi:hypothetical protein